MGEAQKSDICYLYWIHTKEMKDPKCEGYIGISSTPENRFKTHKTNARKGYYTINAEFKSALLEEDLGLCVLVKSTRQYCSDLELALRPKTKIGWNLHIGGLNSQLSRFGHGLSKTSAYKAYKRLSAINDFSPEWTGEGGLKRFSTWFEGLEEYSPFLKVIDKNSLIGEHNLAIFEGRSDMLASQSKLLFSHKLNTSKTLKGWAEYLGIKENTLVCRMSRNDSLDVSLGLVKKEREEDLQKELAIFYLKNTLLTSQQISEKCGFNSCLKRVLKDYKLPLWIFSYAEIPCLEGWWSGRVKRCRAIEGFDTVQSIYEKWFYEQKTVGYIAKQFKLDPHTMKRFINTLEEAKILG